MGDGTILSIIHTVTIGTMLNFNVKPNFGPKYRAEFCYV